MRRARLAVGPGWILLAIVACGMISASAPTAMAADGASAAARSEVDALEGAKHETVDSNGVEIHAVSLGEGPLVVLLHGFPDYWYTWRGLMPELARDHRVVAIDLRGYNRSGRPAGVASYAMPRLVEDVVAVIRHFGAERATIVGHDWGGAIAWSVAMTKPEVVERLVVLNVPHPNGLTRELANNTTQRENSGYAQQFQKPDAHESLTAEGLAGWVREPEARRRYIEAFERSDFEAMLHYYRANYPSLPKDSSDGASDGSTSDGSNTHGSTTDGAAARSAVRPAVQVPVLIIHGLDDPYLLAAGLNGTWDWIDHELTIVTIPGAGHFVHRDEPARVRSAIASWMRRPIEALRQAGD